MLFSGNLFLETNSNNFSLISPVKEFLVKSMYQILSKLQIESGSDPSNLLIDNSQLTIIPTTGNNGSMPNYPYEGAPITFKIYDSSTNMIIDAISLDDIPSWHVQGFNTIRNLYSCSSEFPILDNISENYNVDILILPNGERAKDINSVVNSIKFLSELNCDKEALLISLGGGSVSDHTGFVASIYKRGINYVNIPTTLIGMIDATIGGKKNGARWSAFCKYSFECNVHNIYFECINRIFFSKNRRLAYYSYWSIKYNFCYYLYRGSISSCV